MNNEFNGKLLMFVYINDCKCTFIHVHYHTLDYATLLYMYASYSNVTTDHAAVCHRFGRRYRAGFRAIAEIADRLVSTGEPYFFSMG